MPEENTIPNPVATTPTPGPQEGQPTYTPPASQADLDRIVEARLARERSKYAGFDELKTKAAEFDKLNEAAKTEVQKATERAEKAERDLSVAQAAALRSEVAAAKGLPGELAARLKGNTREELEADADTLKGLVGGSRAPRPTPAQDGQEPTSQGDWLRKAFTR